MRLWCNRQLIFGARCVPFRVRQRCLLALSKPRTRRPAQTFTTRQCRQARCIDCACEHLDPLPYIATPVRIWPLENDRRVGVAAVTFSQQLLQVARIRWDECHWSQNHVWLWLSVFLVRKIEGPSYPNHLHSLGNRPRVHRVQIAHNDPVVPAKVRASLEA